MTHDDWQSFLASDLGKELLAELQLRSRQAQESVEEHMRYRIKPVDCDHINMFITVRNEYDQLIHDFVEGNFNFIDEPMLEVK